MVFASAEGLGLAPQLILKIIVFNSGIPGLKKLHYPWCSTIKQIRVNMCQNSS